jgi:hypothetical protein
MMSLLSHGEFGALRMASSYRQLDFPNLMATGQCMINQPDVESHYLVALHPRNIPDNQQKNYTYYECALGTEMIVNTKDRTLEDSMMARAVNRFVE